MEAVEMRKTFGWLVFALALLCFGIGISIPKILEEGAPYPFGTGAVWSHREYPDPAAQTIGFLGFVLLIGGILLLRPWWKGQPFWKECLYPILREFLPKSQLAQRQPPQRE